MSVTVRLEGMKELEAQLARLKPAAGKAALRRAGVKAMQPMAALAASIAPRDTGELAGSILVSARAEGAGREAGKAAYSAAMRAGLDQGAALTAMRGAQRDYAGQAPVVELFMGPAVAKTKADAIKRIVQEFGSYKMAPNPYMRPAWDQDHDAMLERLQKLLWEEVQKSINRAAKRGSLLG